jgi:CheY-like chemotaxis protein
MSKKLLLADDSITIQKVIGITFANEDYELTVVDNGNAALEKAREVHPDLVLADVFMPGRNGYELCSAIKQDPALSRVPVLLLTGTFEPFDEDKAKNAGADSWIAKPFESQTLIDRVEQLLSAAPAATAEAVAPAVQVETVETVETIEHNEAVAAELSAAGWDDPEVPEPTPSAPLPPAEEDIWSSIAFDEEDLQPAAPELEEEFLFEEETFSEVPEPAAQTISPPSPSAPSTPEPAPADETVALAEAEEPDWGDFEEEILALDESDILEAEELVKDEDEEFVFAVEDAAEPAGEDASPAQDFIFEEEPVEAGAGDRLAMETAFDDAPGTIADDGAAEWEFHDEEGGDALATAKPFEAEDWDFDLTDEPATSREPMSPAASTSPGPEAAAVASAETIVSPTPLPGIEEQAASLSESDLEKIVEQMVGAVIERLANRTLEKVAWEVVPDLAESLIREEIRKIKEKTA